MDNSEKLYQLATQTRQKAYASYSNFKVGAALITESGNIYTGCNVENASYPCGTCAEAGAISAMVAGGDYQISEILIIADTMQIVPCGNCLQKIAEFGTPETLVHSADLNGVQKTFRLKELMPTNFKAEDMNNAQ